MSSSENRKRTVNLKLRCLPEEADEIKDKALDSGVSVSEFLRCAALKRKTRSTIDSQIINELRRLGGLQKHLFTEAGGMRAAATCQRSTPIFWWRSKKQYRGLKVSHACQGSA